jgi:NAD(P)-dependent dehydrogenase (short-subunit alcohol dehydrogenase family)
LVYLAVFRSGRENRAKTLETGLGGSTTPEEIVKGLSLEGKTILITGGHSGIGLVDTKTLPADGARIVVGTRDTEKAHNALAGLKNVTFDHLDLADPISIDTFSDRFMSAHPKLDILINNAGIMALLSLSRESRGYEVPFATNHVGHFQLTARLWEALKAAEGSRIVSLSSYGDRFSGIHFEDIHFDHRLYEKWAAYGQSKPANSLFAVELDRRGQPFGIRAFAVHPGRIPATDLKRFMTPEEQKMAMLSIEILPKDGIRIKSLEEGASTTSWAALSPQLAGKGGVYCADCDISPLVR